MPPLGSHQPPATSAAIAVQNWENITPPGVLAGDTIFALAVDNVSAVLVGGGNIEGKLKFSLDKGLTWGDATHPFGSGVSMYITAAAFGNSRWVIGTSIPAAGTDNTLASSNGVNSPSNFVSHPVAGVGAFTAVNDVVWDPFRNLFIAIAGQGRIATSPDGSNWTIRASGLPFGPSRIAVGPSRVAVALTATGGPPGGPTDGGHIVHSGDAVNWILTPFGGVGLPSCIGYGDGIYVLAADDDAGGFSEIYTSLDAINFAAVATPPGLGRGADVQYDGRSEWLMCASIGNGAIGQIVRSTTRGGSWSYVSPGIAIGSINVPAAKTYRLRFPPPHPVVTDSYQSRRWFGCGDAGVMRSLNRLTLDP